MMEGAADEISEEDFLAAMKFGHAEVVKIVDAQHELAGCSASRKR